MATEVIALLIFIVLCILTLAVFLIGVKLNKLIPGLTNANTTSRGLVVAAGRFDKDGNTHQLPFFSFNLRARQLANKILYVLSFDNFNLNDKYIVKGTVITHSTDAGGSSHIFEVIPFSDTRVSLLGISPNEGLFVLVCQQDGNPITEGFMVEISKY